MSTLSGLASKGEKPKVKFQCLDINSLYRVSRGENLEKQQQKSTLIKHGMQSLGKVPNARRAPKNLPSMKLEHSGTDTAIALVPQGGSGWGKQETTSTSSVSTTTSTTTTSSNNQASTQLTSHEAAIALPVQTTIPPPNKHVLPASADKSWSAVTSGSDPLHPPPYQSPQFQHEFPSLFSGDGAPPRTTDPPHTQGLSLRPQTEGSWIQGGSRLGGEGHQRSNLAPLGAPPQLSAPVGLPQEQQPFPAQYRGVMPPFMYKGNFASNGSGGTQSPNTSSVNGRSRSDGRPLPPRLADTDEVAHRPIIKEEDLSRMDEIGRDIGWACHEDIDYNQKLSFSDDESVVEKSTRRDPKPAHSQKETEKSENHSNESQSKSWNHSKHSNDNFHRIRSGEEDELWVQKKRHQNSKEIDLAVQRAKQRREEEEKRFNESAKKQQELDEKRNRRDREDGPQATINSSAVPSKPMTPINAPLPDYQKERERDRDTRSRTPNDKSCNENHDDKQTGQTSFRHLTQIEGKNLIQRKHSKGSDRDARDRDGQGGGSNFAKFDLPPRFLKQQRSNNMHFTHQYDNRWMSGQNMNKSQNNAPVNMNQQQTRSESPDANNDETRRDFKRQNSDDSYKNSYRPSDNIQKTGDNRHIDDHHDYRHFDGNTRDKEEEKWHHRDKERPEKKTDHGEYMITRQNTEEWHPERRDKHRDEKHQEKYERPQRPDSRDSRASRDSRHSRDSARDSEPKEYLWSEATFESNYEHGRRDHPKEDRRQVPGPITKDRIEADDMKSEKRKLTQLKRGQMAEKKLSDIKRDEKILEKPEYDEKGNKTSHESEAEPKAWADAVSPNTIDPENPKYSDDHERLKCIVAEQSDTENKKQEQDVKDRDNKRNTNSGRGNRSYLQGNKTWSGGNEYHRSGWSKRSSVRAMRSGVPRQLGCAVDFHGTDSEGSTEEHSIKDQRSPKPIKKSEKDDKNRDVKQDSKYSPSEKKNDKRDDNKRDVYVPRGEPSRHGRGGGNFRSRGSIGKRIDGYGPPPTKSPFGNPDEKDKKSSEETPNEVSSVEDKTKQSQQALSAGIIGNSRKETSQNPSDRDRKFTDNLRSKTRKPNDGRRGKSRSKGDNKKSEDNCDTSDNSDENMKDKSAASKNANKSNGTSGRVSLPVGTSRHNNPPRLNNEKRHYGQSKVEENLPRQNSSGTIRSQSGMKKDKPDENTLCNAIADISLKNKEENDVSEDCEEKVSLQGDSDGFQEVKSKKNVKEKPKSEEKPNKPPSKMVEKDIKSERKIKNGPISQLTQQQISNIPSLMSTPVNPPQNFQNLPQPTKGAFDRQRAKLPPRFAKQRENSRLQKVQMQQQHSYSDISELNKVNQTLNVYKMKDSAITPISNAWDKPLNSQLRSNMETDNMLGVAIDKNLEHVQSPNQSGSPNNDKVISKTNQLQDPTLLDGTSPPVNTIIFENTNFKSAPPVSCNARPDKPRAKLEDGAIDNSTVMSGFNKPMVDLMNKNDKPNESMQLPISFKEDNMKLDFFDSDIGHLSDEKISKNICLPRSMHAITSGNSTISTAESLNFKIASVKKVWETPSEHTVVQEDTSTFSSTFVADANSLDPNAFNKGNDVPEDNHDGYSPSPNQTGNNSTTNVCKVKPTQQVSGGSGQTALNSNAHQQHSGMVGAAGLMGHPLSPPPMQPVIGASVGIGQPPQQFTTNQHISYQTGLGGSTQYNMSAIPSPPTVLYNSTQQIQPQTAGLYGPFQIDQTGVLGGQGRSQYSQYPNHYGLGQTASSPYSAQSVYLQTAQPHPPPAAQAPPDLYTNMSNYRLSNTAPFGQNQQLNNPTTVLISSTSNSLMSASVKPSSQQMSAIGTKSGGVGQAYQQQSQQGQVYMAYDPAIQANYLPNAGVMQRGPAGPVQNNVVPALQPSSSYYSGTTGGQTGYFQQPASSTLQSAQLQQHQTGYGLQGNMFGTPNQSHTNAGLQSFNSHFSMQIAAAINAQQYRSGLPTQYIKSVGAQSIGDQAGRPQQLKSPGTQEVLSSVFNSGSQIPSPKSRQNCKQPPPQPSPTGKHNYNLYQGVGNQPTGNVQRYPTPIQRPVNFQQNMSSSQQNANQKHRAASANKAPSRQYYGNQTNPLVSQTDKNEEEKISDNVNGTISCTVNSSTVEKAVIGSNATTTENQSAETTKEKETAAMD